MWMHGEDESNRDVGFKFESPGGFVSGTVKLIEPGSNIVFAEAWRL
jgi:hypothetical protein